MEPLLRISRGRGLHVSVGSAVREHSTMAYKLVVGVDADLQLEHAGGEGTARAFLVPPGCPQAMRASGVAVAVFLDPSVGAVVGTRTGGAACAVGGLLASRLREVCVAYLRQTEGVSDAHGCVDEVFAVMGLTAPTRLDARVERAMRRLRSDPDVPLAVLCRKNLSSERLRHLIVEQTGAGVRAHRLFFRTMHAAERVISGQGLARSAHLAGFADHGHMTRSFGRVFGRPPSSLPADARVLSPWTER